VVLRRSGFRIIARDVGALQILLSAGMLAGLGCALLYGEWYSALGFALAATASAGLGWLTYRLCRNAGDPRSYHALVIAGAGWLIGAIFGGLPFVIIAYITPDDVAQSFVPAGQTYTSSMAIFKNPLHAVFESMSAYTTTGFTMAVHEPSIGHAMLFYRSVAAWIGGAGMIVLSLAIIPRPGHVGGLELYGSETSGTKLRPSIIGTARAIWKVYLIVTAGVTIFLVTATLIFVPDLSLAETAFQAFNHTLAGLSTAGFSPLDDSIAGYKSYPMEMVHLVPMLLGTMSLPLFYIGARERDWRVFWGDAQFRAMVIILGVGIPGLCLLLIGDTGVNDPFREGSFQFISALSTTGWQTSNIGDWSNSAVMWIVWGAMITGGAAGGTVGGIKLIRSYLMVRAAAWRVKKAFLPSEAVVPFTVGDRSLPTHEMHREIADAATFTFLYLLVLMVGIVIAAEFVGPQFTLSDVVFETVSAQSTVGLSAGIVDPDMPPIVEVTFTLQMWIGRLEIFPVIVLLRSVFLWHRRKHR
jgi:trk system potassium uptake protein